MSAMVHSAAMIKRIAAEKRHLSDRGWLTAYYLFSFADYFDASNIEFGNLRVFNDDQIGPHAGFPDHPHENMEIITMVLEGELTHRDSMGHESKIQAGEVQYMSAGAGIIHAEMNRGDVPVHSYQIWIIPSESDLIPTYHQKDFSDVLTKNVLVPLVSGEDKIGAIPMHANATIYNAELEAGNSISFVPNENRGIFIYPREGKLTINDVDLNPGDQARISDEDEIIITALENAKFVLIDVPMG